MMLKQWERAVLYSPVVSGHPIFKRDMRSAAWWRLASDRLPSYTLNTLVRYMIVILSAWVIVYWLSPQAAERLFSSADGWLYSLVVTGIILDFASLLVALHSVSGDLYNGYWDLLRLTPLAKDGIVFAKLAVVRLRVWNVMLLAVSVRCCVALLMALHFLLLPETNWLRRAIQTETPFQLIFAVGALLLGGLVYVIEPWWRMKTMTALGVLLSVHFPRRVLGALVPSLVVVLVWVIQPAALVLILFCVLFLLMPVALITYLVEISNSVFFFLFIACVLAGLTLRWIYQGLQLVSLRRAVLRFDRVLEIEN